MSNSRLEKLMEMLENQPDDAFLMYAVGFEYEAVGDPDKALQYYRSVFENHTTYLPVYYQMGLLQARLGETEEAVAVLKQGIELAKAQNERKTLRELQEALMQMEED